MPKTIDGGLLIIFDGLDGAGKTTQLEIAKLKLEQDGYLVNAAHNLGGTPINEELRKVIFGPLSRPALTDLYIGVAIQHSLSEQLLELRSEGSIILLDRGPLSLAVYQSYGGNASKELAWKYAEEGLTMFNPDLLLVFDVDLDTAIERTGTRNKKADYFANNPRSYFERIKDGYIEAANRHQVTIIDANKTLENVTQDISDLILQSINKKISA